MNSPEQEHTGEAQTGETSVAETVVTEAPAAEPAIVAQPAPASGPAVSAPSARRQPGFQEHPSTLQSLLSVIVIALFVITFIVQAFEIPSESMERTLLIGDYLLVNKIPFGEGGRWGRVLPYRGIDRGDIVVFHYPVDPSQHFVKRVIGLPGDHVRLDNKMVYINGKRLDESYAVHEWGNHESYRDNFPSHMDYSGEVNWRWRTEMQKHLEKGDLVVPQGKYFVMGDNRDRSLDSRYWGFVPRENIVGRPLVIYLSVRQPHRSPGDPGSSVARSLYTLAHIWQFARWDRMFHLVQ